MKLAAQIPWQNFEQLPAPTYAPTMGAPGINTWLMAALHLLSPQRRESPATVGRKPYWPLFSGMQFFPPVADGSLQLELLEISPW